MKKLYLLLLALFLNYAHALEDLDTFLNERGFFLCPVHSHINEGYTSRAQRKIFLNDVNSHEVVKKILEIGFNAGHSCESFLNFPSQPKVVSFDINSNPYTRTGVEFMYEKYGDRFEFIEGDSRSTVAEYAHRHLGEKFDLIFIDGGHDFDCCRSDVINCKALAHENTLLWVDDYDFINGNSVKAAVDACEREGVITILNFKSTSDESGLRAWAIAKYKL